MHIAFIHYQLLKIRKCACTGVRQVGHVLSRLAQDSHTHLWPHGTKACVAAASMHTTQSVARRLLTRAIWDDDDDDGA